MSVYVLYQGQRFEVADAMGDGDAVKDYIQQRLMSIRFIESAWVEAEAADLPPAWLPFGSDGKRATTAEGEAIATSAHYTVYPDDRGDVVLYDPYLRLVLKDTTSLNILVHDRLEIAVLSGTSS